MLDSQNLIFNALGFRRENRVDVDAQGYTIKGASTSFNENEQYRKAVILLTEPFLR